MAREAVIAASSRSALIVVPWRSPNTIVAGRAAVIVGPVARRHRMAVEQDRVAEPRPGLGQRLGQRRMIGAVDRLDPPLELGARDALAPDRAGAGDPRRDQAEAAAGPRRLDEAARRQRRRDQRRGRSPVPRG